MLVKILSLRSLIYESEFVRERRINCIRPHSRQSATSHVFGSSNSQESVDSRAGPKRLMGT